MHGKAIYTVHNLNTVHNVPNVPNVHHEHIVLPPPCAGSEVTLLKVERFGSHQTLLEPLDDVPGCWDGQALFAVMAHQPNHWITYRKANNGQWFCLDSATPGRIQRRNPFNHQHSHTIDFIVFRQ